MCSECGTLTPYGDAVVRGALDDDDYSAPILGVDRSTPSSHIRLTEYDYLDSSRWDEGLCLVCGEEDVSCTCERCSKCGDLLPWCEGCAPWSGPTRMPRAERAAYGRAAEVVLGEWFGLAGYLVADHAAAGGDTAPMTVVTKRVLPDLEVWDGPREKDSTFFEVKRKARTTRKNGKQCIGISHVDDFRYLDRRKRVYIAVYLEEGPKRGWWYASLRTLNPTLHKETSPSGAPIWYADIALFKPLLIGGKPVPAPPKWTGRAA